MKKWKLVIHIPESRCFITGVKMAINFVKAIDNDNFSVKVLVNAEGVNILKNFEEVKEIFREALYKNVEVYFCENAMKAFSINHKFLPEGSYTVPAGIKALVEWQNEGYSYVRA